MKNYKIFLPFVLVIILCTSCVKHKNLLMLQNDPGKEYPSLSISTYRISSGDILSIKLNNLETTTSQFFRRQDETSFTSIQPNPAYFFSQGYIVSDSGKIELPIIGEISVQGKTTKEIEREIAPQLREYLKFASINVKLANYKISVLGEVNKPGVQYIYEEKFTLFQALANAADVTDFANRKIKIIREKEIGTYTKYLDLKDPEIVYSEYYHLQPNDVIYVEPLKAKAFNINTRTASVILSAVSVLLVAINLIVK
ncbi:polysaccharide biosynthesis/export family protein [Rapidithrix thailandica]|uniref:Polysaccharide biosynthesis/export family protein n=1 Tax=Rapidithrix thailandica TaxID=413964 RepID=A0AAW9SIQ3_9BACT